MMEKRVQVTCVLCPRGCTLAVRREGGRYVVAGAQCKKGEPYAISELEHPERILTTTVATVFKDMPRLAVKTDRAMPLERTFEFMAIINGLIVEKRLVPGGVVLEDIAGSGINVIATDNMTRTMRSMLVELG